MTKPILDFIEESVQDMRDGEWSCPFSSLEEHKRGCSLCKLLFPEVGFISAKCPCNRLGDSYVKAVMRHFFPEKETL